VNCKAYINGCLHCDAVETCTRCDTGFKLSPNKLHCVKNVTDCLGTPIKTKEGYLLCDTCKEGFYQGYDENGIPDIKGCI